MSDNKQNPSPNSNQASTVRLDDESRVKVLSPSMLVFKRFVRNRLAITGVIILIAMFLFSFVGAFISPYTQSQVFYTYDTMWKDYASVIENKELRYVAPAGQDFSLAARSQFILAMTNGRSTFTADGVDYTFVQDADGFYRILSGEVLGSALNQKMGLMYSPAAGQENLSDGLMAAFEAGVAEGDSGTFEYEGDTYAFSKAGKTISLSRTTEAAIASMTVFDAYDQTNESLVSSFEFRLGAEMAMANGENSFVVDGVTYQLEMDEDAVTIYKGEGSDRAEFAIASVLIASSASPDIYINVAFKNAILETINDGKTAFTFTDADGVETDYQITLVNNTYTVKRETVTQLYDQYAAPSKEHWLGTDANGMDMLTRLMYGGRISLLVGFVVVFIELFIGVIVGGIAGYFGGWIDTLLMRFIDLFNCIPYWPVMIITGAVMDSFEVDPTARIFLLMLILGVMNWTGIARVVRGQILTLREQDFMVATEATGIRVTRRIFRHLVPNVMPLLIVQATMGLGSIIITEATLSFLGLGLKYPMASWGTIINAATSIYVMTNYWYIWIPAGFLILLTVLGFNFVGDGLRDAFDPKMKR